MTFAPCSAVSREKIGLRDDSTAAYTDVLGGAGRMNRSSIPGAYPRGSERAGGSAPAAAASEGGIPARAAALPGGAVIPAAVSVPLPVPSHACFVRLTRFAGYAGVLAIVVLSLVPGQWRPSIGLAKAFEHAIAYSIVAAVLALAGGARRPQILLLVALAGALEIGQAWVPGRDSNPTDFIGSSAGILLGFGFSSLVLAYTSRLSGMRLVDSRIALPFPLQLRAVGTILAVGAVAVAVSVAAAPGAAGWLGAGLALVMLAIAVVDRQRFLIPNSLNAAGLALGVLHSVVLGWEDVGVALAGAVLRAAVLGLAFFVLRLLYARLRGRQGIGLGDVKLAVVAGSWLGWSIMPIAVEIAAMSALSVYTLSRYALRRPLRSSSRLPFGLYFAPAIWIGWLLQATILQAW
jgi:leader peptidase (prepilin peptidase) / N-methyltransferase